MDGCGVTEGIMLLFITELRENRSGVLWKEDVTGAKEGVNEGGGGVGAWSVESGVEKEGEERTARGAGRGRGTSRDPT